MANEKLTDLEKAYKKELANLKKRISYQAKKGYTLPVNIIPDIPASGLSIEYISQIKNITAKEIKEASQYIPIFSAVNRFEEELNKLPDYKKIRKRYIDTQNHNNIISRMFFELKSSHPIELEQILRDTSEVWTAHFDNIFFNDSNWWSVSDSYIKIANLLSVVRDSALTLEELNETEELWNMDDIQNELL